MSAEDTWRSYAHENYAVACLALERGYYNACLQNVQQSVEKYLKSEMIRQGVAIKRTHNIELLSNSLNDAGVETGLTDDQCELLDAIYIPSKYPTGGVLPDFEPDAKICMQCIEIADKVRSSLKVS
jgi:HEPN domain-containing protein